MEQTQKIKVKENRPIYRPAMLCYVVEYSIDGDKNGKYFDSYKEGIEWLKTTFPAWFAKHYKTATT